MEVDAEPKKNDRACSRTLVNIFRTFRGRKSWFATRQVGRVTRRHSWDNGSSESRPEHGVQNGREPNFSGKNLDETSRATRGVNCTFPREETAP